MLCSLLLYSYHRWCLGKSLVGVDDAKVYVCSFCRFLEDPLSNQNEVSLMVCILLFVHLLLLGISWKNFCIVVILIFSLLPKEMQRDSTRVKHDDQTSIWCGKFLCWVLSWTSCILFFLWSTLDEFVHVFLFVLDHIWILQITVGCPSIYLSLTVHCPYANSL